jgi:protein SCO1
MKTRLLISLSLISGLWIAGSAFGQGQAVSGVGGNAGNAQFASINAATDVKWEQKLGNPVSLDTVFTDESGKEVALSSYFGKKPVVLVMPFYKCAGICTAELNELSRTVKDKLFTYQIGRDFDVVTISINPNEGPEMALGKKKEYMSLLGQPGAETSWHFLTGKEANIRKIADEVGFRYKMVSENNYAHPGGLILLSPQGKVSSYLFGAAFFPKDLQLGLTQAGEGKTGSITDKFVLLCYHYDPATGKYGLAVMRLLQVVGTLTVLSLGSFIFLNLRQEKTQQLVKLEEVKKNER